MFIEFMDGDTPDCVEATYDEQGIDCEACQKDTVTYQFMRRGIHYNMCRPCIDDDEDIRVAR